MLELLKTKYTLQDCGKYMLVNSEGKNYRVAVYSNANKTWMMLPEGIALAEAMAPAEEVEGKPKRGRKAATSDESE
jgi:hypothetical protein